MTNSEYTQNVMANVVEILKERNMTPSAFAEMLGLNRSTIHRYINGERNLTAFRVQMFADTLNVPVRQLLTLIPSRVTGMMNCCGVSEMEFWR